MALIKYIAPAAELSGSVGGVTYARVHGAKACRIWRAPVNKKRPIQLAIRQKLSLYSSQWFHALVQDQRDSWNVYAATCGFTNPLGDPYTISGFNMFVRTMTTLAHFDAGAVSWAPSESGFPPSYTLTFSLIHATGVLTLTDVDPAPPAEDYALVTIFNIIKASRSYPAGVRLYHAAFSLVAGTPIVLYTYTNPLPGVAGQYQGLLSVRWLDGEFYRLGKPTRHLVPSA